jgi:GH25 family lysozyme M1 (1,4-beta-N-acetylmuramidase)
MGIILKPNSGIDLSSWEQGIVLSSLTFKPSFVSTRASIGSVIDTTWQGIQSQAHAMQTPFMAFHYFMNLQSSADQAKLLWDTVKGSWMPGDKLCLDYEDRTSKFSLHAAADFFYNLNQVSGVPLSEMVFYSQASILNTLNSPTDWKYLLQIPFWTSGVPNNPDLYNDIPPAYIPSGMTRAANAFMWQYYINYLDAGYSGALDVDYIDPAYLAKWKAEYNWTTIPPVVIPPTTQPDPIIWVQVGHNSGKVDKILP